MSIRRREWRSTAMEEHDAAFSEPHGARAGPRPGNECCPGSKELQSERALVAPSGCGPAQLSIGIGSRRWANLTLRRLASVSFWDWRHHQPLLHRTATSKAPEGATSGRESSAHCASSHCHPRMPSRIYDKVGHQTHVGSARGRRLPRLRISEGGNESGRASAAPAPPDRNSERNKRYRSRPSHVGNEQSHNWLNGRRTGWPPPSAHRDTFSSPPLRTRLPKPALIVCRQLSSRIGCVSLGVHTGDRTAESVHQPTVA
ncbi:hypothetical protein C8Q79DRAFT_417951 [Trametes meyenii]|nr:hypothetical protein C8Q79DRAFT_417951 [Trametes meyenii]